MKTTILAIVYARSFRILRVLVARGKVAVRAARSRSVQSTALHFGILDQAIAGVHGTAGGVAKCLDRRFR